MNYYIDVLKKYAVFNGRASRMEYWMFVLISFIISIILSIVDNAIHSPMLESIYGLAVFVPSIAVGVRRLHDTGKSGWWLLIALIPVVGAIVLIVFFILDSQPGDNAYSTNPMAAPYQASQATVAPQTPQAPKASQNPQQPQDFQTSLTPQKPQTPQQPQA